MPVDLTVTGGVAVMTLNRPEKLNALDAAMFQGLSDAWSRIRDDDAIRTAVVTGAGDRAFTAGADLRSFSADASDFSRFWRTQHQLLLNRGLELWKPVVAAVNGYCLGGGMTLLLATDIRLATATATFGLSEVNRGLLPGNGGTQRLLEQLPHAVGMEMLLTGEPIDADAAFRWGLVNQVVPAEQLMDRAIDYATRLAAQPPLALQAAKEMALRARDLDRASGLRLEQAMLRVLQLTEDADEGARAFVERRDPHFSGR